MAQRNRAVVGVGGIIAVILMVSLFSWSGMMGSWGWTNMGGGMMGGWGQTVNHGRSLLLILVLVPIAVGIGGIVIWAMRKPRLH